MITLAGTSKTNCFLIAGRYLQANILPYDI